MNVYRDALNVSKADFHLLKPGDSGHFKLDEQPTWADSVSSPDPNELPSIPHQAMPEPLTKSQVSAGELSVLFVDESSADRFLLRTALLRARTARYQIYESSDIHTARELVRRYRLDAVLLDFHLGDCDAIAGMENLIILQPEMAFIIVTRQGDETSAVRAMKAGSAEYLLKDQVLYDPIHLDRAVQSAVYTKRLERENRLIIETLRTKNVELEQLNKKLWEMSHTDELTACHNRRYITSRLEEEIYRGLRYGMPLSAVMMDLDHFKRINDTHGHLAGDQVLQHVAHTLRVTLRETDLVGRFGGEEFLLLLPNTDQDGAEIICNRLREKIASQPISIGDRKLSITASFGVARLCKEYSNAALLLKASDQNLFRAKAMGRNCVISCATKAEMTFSI
jgi:two-component system, cell cycle response regulator